MENNNGTELVIVTSEQASDNESLPLTVDSLLSMASLELTHERYVSQLPRPKGRSLESQDE